MRPLIASTVAEGANLTFWSMTNALDTDRYITTAELIERWPIGRTKTCELDRGPGFPDALVLVRDRNGRPRSMGFLLSEVVEKPSAKALVPTSPVGPFSL
jgi:hypothetical protein